MKVQFYSSNFTDCIRPFYTPKKIRPACFCSSSRTDSVLSETHVAYFHSPLALVLQSSQRVQGTWNTTSLWCGSGSWWASRTLQLCWVWSETGSGSSPRKLRRRYAILCCELRRNRVDAIGSNFSLLDEEKNENHFVIFTEMWWECWESDIMCFIALYSVCVAFFIFWICFSTESLFLANMTST